MAICLSLSNGQGSGEPLKVSDCQSILTVKYAIAHIAIVELVYDTRVRYTLHLCMETEWESLRSQKLNGVVGVDIGEIHPMVSP